MLGQRKNVRELRGKKLNMIMCSTDGGHGRDWHIIGSEPIWEEGKECFWVMCLWPGQVGLETVTIPACSPLFGVKSKHPSCIHFLLLL